MAGGRPSKFRKEYCTEIIEHCKTGLSFASFAGKLGISIQTLDTWTKVHPEFLEAKKIAEAHSLYAWERMGLLGMSGKTPGFNAGTYIFNMKNRFHWRDRIEQTNTNVDMTFEQMIYYMKKADEA